MGDQVELTAGHTRLVVVTAAPNAFRSGDGLHVLEPGEEFRSVWGLALTSARL
ncbi:MAG TPA: hypothetical protein VKE27_06160 [Candidatus Dormibacteraeota bacterium]|nr:hypothetical protein [Candidatus Dormibacteraeota bacterium]